MQNKILGDVDEIVNFGKRAQELEPGFFPCPGHLLKSRN
jgi:hypothetical protein